MTTASYTPTRLGIFCLSTWDGPRLDDEPNE